MFPCCSCSSTSGRMDLKQIPSMDEIEFPIKPDENPETNEKLDSLATPKSYKRLRNSFYQQDIGCNEKSNTKVKTIATNDHEDGENRKSRKTNSSDRFKLKLTENEDDDTNRNEDDTTTECDEVIFPFTTMVKVLIRYYIRCFLSKLIVYLTLVFH